MLDALRGWFWWLVCGVFLPHAWHLAGDWRRGGGFRWRAVASGDHEFAGIESGPTNSPFSNGAIQIECRHCKARGFGHFERPTKRYAWKNGVPDEWALVSEYGFPVAGGPTHKEIEAEIG